MPRTYEELVARRQALALWAEQPGGCVGRSPDHVASSLSCGYSYRTCDWPGAAALVDRLLAGEET